MDFVFSDRTVVVVHLVSGEEIIGEATNTPTGITIKSPLRCLLSPGKGGEVSVTLIPFLPCAKDPTDTTVSLLRERIMFVYEPNGELSKMWRQSVSPLDLGTHLPRNLLQG